MSALLVILVCTVIGLLVGHPGVGLIVGCLLVAGLIWAGTSRRY